MSLDDLGKQARDVVPQTERLLKDGRPRLRFLRASFSEVEALKVDMYAERKLVQEGERVPGEIGSSGACGGIFCRRYTSPEPRYWAPSRSARPWTWRSGTSGSRRSCARSSARRTSG